MPSITPDVMVAFLGELEKRAFRFTPSSQLGRGGLALGAGLTGAAMGGLYKGQGDYRQAREQGAGIGQSLAAGAKGALKGGLVGGGVAAAAGAAMPGVGRTVRDFGGQNLHMWTGAGGKRALTAFGSGTAATGRRLKDTKQTVSQAAIGTAPDPRWFSKYRQPISKEQIHALAQKEHAHALEAHQAMGRAQDMGLMSAPGAIKAFATDPRAAARAAWDATTKGTGTGTKAFMLGVPGAMAAYGAIRKPGEDETRLGNVAGSIGQALPMALPWFPTSIAMAMIPGTLPNPSMVAGNLLEQGGKRVGNAAQRTVTGAIAPPARQAPGGAV